MAGGSAADFELGLLQGFAFACRSGCALCCYASPAVTPAERARLVQIRPELPVGPEEDGFALLPTRPNGGACVLLRGDRCTAHAARPFPCRTYPLQAHVGRRLQVTLVLACPGLDLGALATWAAPGGARAGPRGFESELGALAEEGAQAPLLAWMRDASDEERRLLRRIAHHAGPEDPEEVRARLRRTPGGPDPTQQLCLPPPGEDAPLEELPVLFHGQYGRVALRSTDVETYELLGLHENGTPPERLAEIPLPEELPRLDPEAAELLGGYQRYLVDRDHLLWSTYLEMSSGRPGALSDELAANLTEATTEALRRASVLARFGGADGDRLGAEELLAGIRAVDSELLDRPTLGRIL